MLLLSFSIVIFRIKITITVMSDGTAPAFPTTKKKHDKCIKYLKKGVSSMYVKYMLTSMTSLGYKMSLSQHFSCEPCGPSVAGGFDPIREQVILCENNILSQSHMNEVLTHELIHVYDNYTVNIDWNDMRHLACTEIRAANLSNECRFNRETFLRLNFGMKAHNQTCVKNRAALSMTTVHQNLSLEEAREIVSSVFSQCYTYTSPFTGIPPIERVYEL